jgi:hypothetical protein
MLLKRGSGNATSFLYALILFWDVDMKLIELTKVCTKCGKRKNWKEFSKAKRGYFGIRADCKMCQHIYSIYYQKINKKEKSIYNKQYCNNHIEELRIKRKKHYNDNKKKALAYAKKYREMYPGKIKAKISSLNRLKRSYRGLQPAIKQAVKSVGVYNRKTMLQEKIEDRLLGNL